MEWKYRKCKPTTATYFWKGSWNNRLNIPLVCMRKTSKKPPLSHCLISVIRGPFFFIRKDRSKNLGIYDTLRIDISEWALENDINMSLITVHADFICVAFDNEVDEVAFKLRFSGASQE